MAPTWEVGGCRVRETTGSMSNTVPSEDSSGTKETAVITVPDGIGGGRTVPGWGGGGEQVRIPM